MTTLPGTIPERIILPPSARGMATGAAEMTMTSPTASDLLAMLRRRTLLITVLFVLFGATAGGGFAAWWIYFPGYRTESLIECISNVPEADLTVEQQRLREDEHERFVMTQALLLKSPTVLGEALKVTPVRETEWYRSVEPDRRLLELTEELSAGPVRGTNFLRASMECRNRRDAAVIVNEVVNLWYQQVKERSAMEFADEPLREARQERDRLVRDINEDRQRLRSISERLPAGARQNPHGNIVNQQVAQFAEQVAIAKLELSQLEQYRRIYHDPQGVAVTAEDRAYVELSPEVAELARALYLLEQRRAASAKIYGPEHSALKQLDAQIAATDEKLSQLRLAKLNERRADMREATNTAYHATQQRLLLAQENLLLAEAALQDQDRLLFEYTTLEDEVQRKVEYHQQLLDYIKSLERVRGQRTAVRVSVAQPATDPLERNSPSLRLIPLGVFLALALSVGIGLAVELLDKSVRTSQDVLRHLDAPLLAVVPHTDDEEVAIERVETAIRDHPQSMVAEAFRRLRANLQFSAPAQRQRTVLVTSPREHDGKTTVACNLAVALALGGRRVLLVDANFRRPTLHRLFENVKPQGLSNLLIGDGDLSAFASATNVPRLDVLGCGPMPPNPVELLSGEAPRAFLAEAARRYDQVIVDTAPVLLTSEAQVLGTAVDGVILVVRAKHNTRGASRRAVLLLAETGAKLFGAVLNAAQVTRGGYFREQFRAYYEYQSGRDEDQKLTTEKTA